MSQSGRFLNKGPYCTTQYIPFSTWQDAYQVLAVKKLASVLSCSCARFRIRIGTLQAVISQYPREGRLAEGAHVSHPPMYEPRHVTLRLTMTYWEECMILFVHVIMACLILTSFIWPSGCMNNLHPLTNLVTSPCASKWLVTIHRAASSKTYICALLWNMALLGTF